MVVDEMDSKTAHSSANMVEPFCAGHSTAFRADAAALVSGSGTRLAKKSAIMANQGCSHNNTMVPAINGVSKSSHPPQKLKSNSSDYEVVRKLFHSCHSILAVALYIALPNTTTTTALSYLILPCIGFIYVDHCRLLHRKSFAAHVFYKYGHFFLRPSEQHELTASSSYFVGIMLTFAWWDREMALLAFLFLAIVDSGAAFGGRWFSKRIGERNVQLQSMVVLDARGVRLVKSGKTVCGLGSAMLSGAAVYCWYAWYNGHAAHAWQVALAGCIAGVSELFTLYGVDDDLSLPIFSGILLSTFRRALNIKPV